MAPPVLSGVVFPAATRPPPWWRKRQVRFGNNSAAQGGQQLAAPTLRARPSVVSGPAEVLPALRGSGSLVGYPGPRGLAARQSHRCTVQAPRVPPFRSPAPLPTGATFLPLCLAHSAACRHARTSQAITRPSATAPPAFRPLPNPLRVRLALTLHRPTPALASAHPNGVDASRPTSLYRLAYTPTPPTRVNTSPPPLALWRLASFAPASPWHSRHPDQCGAFPPHAKHPRAVAT